MPDDHSEVVPLLPIPNRTVKRLSADDSADSRVKVGHRQAVIPRSPTYLGRAFCVPAASSIVDPRPLATQRPACAHFVEQRRDPFRPRFGCEMAAMDELHVIE